MNLDPRISYLFLVAGWGEGGGGLVRYLFHFSCIIVAVVVIIVIYNLRIPVNLWEFKLVVLCCNRFCNEMTNTVYPESVEITKQMQSCNGIYYSKVY
jgi:hypothetical protein